MLHKLDHAAAGWINAHQVLAIDLFFAVVAFVICFCLGMLAAKLTR